MSAMSRAEFLWDVQAYRAQGLSDEQIADRMGLRASTFGTRLDSAVAMSGSGVSDCVGTP